MGVGCQSASCSKKAVQKCRTVAENIRVEVFKSFWELGDFVFKDNSLSHMDNFRAKRVANNSSRQTTHKYYLTFDNAYPRTPVRKRMFLSTFGISEKDVIVTNERGRDRWKNVSNDCRNGQKDCSGNK
ncbi:hypothetical protein PoB_003256000 [Plakobranchus ocellatus]|uniref:Uncharacterized protein n=1 Tax=Plakobranchus ocellatus TaxID=259542 RepID=A0AAV4AD16_9GAST|nr:hypothetical protein PoB_003256000 [Plakobranchus ocellatus]